MPEKLKDIFFTKEFINDLADSIKKNYRNFDKENFIRLVLNKEWNNKELKERMHHITECLHNTLPKDYSKALRILEKAAPQFKSFDAMVFPDFVEHYGIEYWEISMRALELFTKQCSSEFAIRPFIAKNSEKAMKQMQKWANSKNEHVRRLASEGCRPRLPWAMALPEFKKDPSPILPILEKLKDDESESVRRSVANNLNDISKDNPKLALKICKSWLGKNDKITRIVKHASRDMLKSGNNDAMMLFGFGDPKNIVVKDLLCDNQKLSIGDKLNFTFTLNIKSRKQTKARLEYIVYFQKMRGKISRKVFQIKEGTFKPGEHKISKSHSFIDHSTRKHYQGDHQISIIVNGVEKATKSIMLSR